MAFLTRALVFCQACVPSLLRSGAGGLAAAIFLDEVEAGERDVELGLVGELEDHQLQRRLAGLINDAQAAVLRDAVFDVNHVVTYGEVAEVGDEGGGLGLAADNGAGLNVGVVHEIVCAEENNLACGGAAIGVAQVENLHAVCNRRLHDDGRLQVARKVARLAVDGLAPRRLRARAEAVRDLILLQQAGEAFHFALIRRGD